MAIGFTRRAALGAGAGALAFGFSRRSSAPTSVQPDLELFAFPTPGDRSLVFAVAISAAGAPFAHPDWVGFDVRIHAGGKSWAIKGSRPPRPGTVSERLDGRLFVGEVLGRHLMAGARCRAVVLETPPDFVRAGERLAVWADVCGENGSRFRVGNPLVAELLARDPVLCNTYHATSPAEDRASFADALAQRIASAAAASGTVADPAAHGQRLAGLLLPDVIIYRPDLPAGYTFASQNGRRPADDTRPVVATVLTGAVAPQAGPTSFPSTDAFPYFCPVVAA